ncbi:MAG: hypothetical protein AAF570_02810 [Bacteroidota bacterium]
MVQIPAQNVGIGTNVPDDKLDVAGDAHVQGYLKVGNPVPPTTISPDGLQLFEIDNGSYYNGFTQNGCGVGWLGTITGPTLPDRGCLQYDNTGARGNQNLFSPWIWVPTNATQVIFEVNHYCTLENNFDGVRLQYSFNGTVWNDIPAGNFFLGGYNGNTGGSNATCTGNLNAQAWTGVQDLMVSAGFVGLTGGTWLQFRFVGMEDASVGTGIYYLFNFGVFCDYGGNSFGGAFATGNVYAENNVYAGSNVLLGDLAEYFPLVGKAEPGDLISMVPGADRYSVSTRANDPSVIGIYSSNPTLTLNDPNSGIPVGLQGRVPVNVTLENGGIQKGDYLMASSTPGKAMKATDAGFIVGRALESLDQEGQIICLIETGWFNPNAGAQTNSGHFTLPKGHKEIRVIDPTVTPESRIFLTMLADPVHRYWISDKEDGAFTINLSGNTKSDLPFDYFVDGAQRDVAPIPSIAVADATQVQSSTPVKNPNAPDNSMKVEGDFQDLPFNTGATPPASVPNPDQGYFWSEKTGLQESGKAATD